VELLNTSKRSQTDLYATILEVIKSHPEGARITRISYGVGVPVDRLKKMVNSLTSYGLVMMITEDEENFFAVTPRGIDFLETYWKMKGFLASFDDKNA
jgi:predicted transcriptional regulator